MYKYGLTSQSLFESEHDGRDRDFTALDGGRSSAPAGPSADSADPST